MLDSAGYRVIEAANAEEAQRALSILTVDILLTDINLPGQSGIDLARQAQTLFPGIRVVFASGDTRPVEGISSVSKLLKPYSNEDSCVPLQIRSAATTRDSRRADSSGAVTGAGGVVVEAA